eukprot:7121641-Pyramimonas_sp.AAC.1
MTRTVDVPDMVLWHDVGASGRNSYVLRGVEVSGIAFWHYSGSWRRNSNIGSRRWGLHPPPLSLAKGRCLTTALALLS